MMPTVNVILADNRTETIDITEYTCCVLPAEMPDNWPTEALRAQAVCIQSYALAKGTVYADQRDQVYNPSKRTAITDAIAREMAGYVGMVDGRIAHMFYSSSCGGHTDNTWAPEYLHSVDCPCARKRYGHGQGLCQYGAKALATKGMNWQQIIAYYYNVTLASNWGVPCSNSKSTMSFQIQRNNPESWIVDAVLNSGVKLVKVLDPSEQQPFGSSVGYIVRLTFPHNADANMIYAGKAGAESWWDNVQPRLPLWATYVEGPNEPVINDEQQAMQFVDFEKHRQDIVLQHGFIPASGIFGTGNPAHFELFRILGEALCREGVVYARHSYGMRVLDPTDWSWEWHVLRHRKDWQALEAAGYLRPDTMITEFGIDFSGNPEKDGWRAQGISASQYMGGIELADKEFIADGIKLITPFIWADHNWPSFRMTEEVTKLFVQYVLSQHSNSVEPLPEHDVATGEKVRWWLEELARQYEAGNTDRMRTILYSLIKLASQL
jgi:hypothetical protein